jgi:hypothetical protein
VIWQKDSEGSSKLYRALEKAVNDNAVMRKNFAKLKRLSVNRKMLLLSIDNREE